MRKTNTGFQAWAAAAAHITAALGAALVMGTLGAACDADEGFPTFTHDTGGGGGSADDGAPVPGTPAPGDAGETPDEGAPPADVPTRGDAPPTADAPAPGDAGPGDTGGGEDVPPPVDTTKPELRSAFSAQQGIVTARFSEPVAAGAGVLGNYEIRASNNQVLPILAATPDPAASQYVRLSVDQGAIDPALSYTLTVKNVADGAGNVIGVPTNKAKVTRTLYLNIVWHQHQPLYLDPTKDQLSGPWVRKHSQKSYYDMTSIIADYPKVHFNVNLTSVLLRQLQDYYVERMEPFIDVFDNTMDVEGFLAAWQGKTDPFIDFLLLPTPSAETITEEQLELVWKGAWTLVSTADPIMQRFPEYVELRDANRAEYDYEDFLALKIWFEIAWMDPDFIQGPVTLPDGSATRVHEWLTPLPGEKYKLAVPPSEQLARDLVIESFKIMKNVVLIHKELFFNVDTGLGQVEVTTTPMYHPILPLIYDSDLMGQSQPFDPKPEPNFSYPQDAKAQVLRAVRFYEDLFGVKPRGIWCGEGSVAEEIVPLLVEAGFEWTATDHEVLKRAKNDDAAPVYYPYLIDGDTVPGNGGDTDDEMLIIFRETYLSDAMGFEYKTWKGDDGAQHFLDGVTGLAPTLGGEDRLLSIILDGENAWEWYTQEHDAKGFFHALYGKLSEAYDTGEIVTVTTSEFIHGNPQRAVPAHPIGTQEELEPLWPGSWIGATYNTWIGEVEENKGWEYLRKTRSDLEATGLPQPNPLSGEPTDKSSVAWEIWRAFDQMYAAEGSDWFWWYGVDQTTPSNDDSPFDRAFRSQLLGVYEHANLALEMLGQPTILVPDFPPLIQAKPTLLDGPYEPDASPPKPSPVIDGAFLPNETEWTPPGGFFFDSDSSTAISNTDDITTVYYGYDADAFYVGLQMSETLHPKIGSPYKVMVLVDHKDVLDADLGTFVQDPANGFTPPGEAFEGMQVARRLVADFEGAEVTLRLEQADGSGGWAEVAGHSAALGGPQFGATVLEFRWPFVDLGLTPVEDPLNFYVAVEEGGEIIDAAPNLDPKRVFDDVTNLVFVTFEVNATGSQIPLETLGLNTPPPPLGNGTVYIVGEPDKLGGWVPNKVALSDSGQNGDVTPNDGIWTGVFGFPRGDVVKYKYTVGTGTNEGQWGGTEEFPFTNRQYVVPAAPDVVSVRIQDVLGDDPPNENSMGGLSAVTETTE